MRRVEAESSLLPRAGDRAGRDRLEILTALISGPSFDPLFRPDIITIPGGHAIYRWACVVADCERPRGGGADLCSIHQGQWREDGRGGGMAAFVTAARPDERVGSRAVMPDLSAGPGAPQ